MRNRCCIHAPMSSRHARRAGGNVHGLRNFCRGVSSGLVTAQEVGQARMAGTTEGGEP